MKPGKITHTFAALLSSVSSLFAHGAVTKAEPTKVKLSKKSEKKSDESRVGVDSLTFTPSRLRSAPPSPFARIAGSRFARATKSSMRNEKIAGRFAPTIGNTFSATNGRNQT